MKITMLKMTMLIMTMLNGIPNRRGKPSVLRLQCSIIPNLNTGIYNSATNQTINYHLYNIYNTDVGG